MTNIRIYIVYDSSLYSDYKDAQEGAQMLNVEDWPNKVLLVTFSLRKTESMIFTQKRNPEIPLLQMKEIDVKEVRKHKLLESICREMTNGQIT